MVNILSCPQPLRPTDGLMPILLVVEYIFSRISSNVHLNSSGDEVNFSDLIRFNKRVHYSFPRLTRHYRESVHSPGKDKQMLMLSYMK